MSIIHDYCNGSVDMDDVVDTVLTLDDEKQTQFTKDILMLVLALLEDIDNIGQQYGEVDDNIASDHDALLQDFYIDAQSLI